MACHTVTAYETIQIPGGEIEIEVDYSVNLIPYRAATHWQPAEGGVEDVDIEAVRLLDGQNVTLSKRRIAHMCRDVDTGELEQRIGEDSYYDRADYEYERRRDERMERA